MNHFFKGLALLSLSSFLVACKNTPNYDVYPIKGKYVESENLQRNLVDERTQELEDEI